MSHKRPGREGTTQKDRVSMKEHGRFPRRKQKSQSYDMHSPFVKDGTPSFSANIVRSVDSLCPNVVGWLCSGCCRIRGSCLYLLGILASQAIYSRLAINLSIENVHIFSISRSVNYLMFSGVKLNSDFSKPSHSPACSSTNHPQSSHASHILS